MDIVILQEEETVKLKKYLKMALGAIALVAFMAAGAVLVPGSKAASGQPAQVPMSQVDTSNLSSAAGRTNVPAPSFPAAAGVICPSSVSPLLTAPAVKGTSSASMAEVQDQLSAFETSVKGAASATPDKRTSALATCYFAPAIYLNPKSVTINTGQTFQFTLEVFYSEYGCDLSWAGHVATDPSGHFPANQSGAVTYTSPSWASAGTYNLTVSCGGLGGTGVDQIVVTVLGASSGGGNPPGNPCDQQSTSQMWATFMGGTINGTPMVQGSTLTVTAGASLQYQMSFRNDGACPWNAALAVRAGSTNPDNNLNLGASRVYIPAGVTYTTGQTWPINTFFNAPTVAGCYTVGWRMVKEYVVWFGSQTNASWMTLCVTGSVPPPPTSTTTPTTTTPPAPASTLVCNRVTTGPVLFTGKLTGADGQPVVGIASATATTGPEVACASTDSAGNITLRADPNDPSTQTAIQNAVTSNDGWLYLNIEAISGTTGLAAESGTTRKWSGTEWLAPSNNLGAASAGIGLSAAHLRIPIKLNPKAANVVKLRPTRRRLQSASAFYNCLTPSTTVVSTTVAPVIFGNLHTSPNMTATIAIQQNAETDVDTAISANGTNWSISANASSHVGNTSTAKIPQGADQGYQYRMNVQFEKVKIFRDCVLFNTTHYKVRAVKWTGGTSVGNNTHNLDHHCLTTYSQFRTVLPRGSVHTVSNFRSIRYGASATVFGLTLGATTENKKSVTQVYTVGNQSVTHSMCGTDDFFNQASTRLGGD